MTQTGARILLVEDEATITSILETLLREAQHVVESVGSAEAALEALARGPFDVVVTDKNLPGMTGLGLMEELTRRGPPPRMILITGYPSVGAAVEALDAGFLGFLVKPFRHLRDAVDEVARVLALPEPRRRHDDAQHLRSRLQGDASVAPPLSALIIAPPAASAAIAARVGAPNTVQAADLAAAQRVLAQRKFAAVVATELSTLIDARARLPEAAMLYCGDASFADVLELIRLVAALSDVPSPEAA